MDPNKFVDLQLQMRQNQDELADYLREMETWEKDIKVKEEQLVSKQSLPKDPVLPPVRNSMTKKALKKKKKLPKEGKVLDKQPKIRGSDYRSWDKFDVEKACSEVDKEESHKSSSSEYETDEEAEETRKKQLANSIKDEGNQYFKKEQYDMAVECYSRAIELDSDNAILLLNRAMALLKQEKFGAAEQDCTRAIAMGTKDAKAWFRRGCARESLKRYQDALADFQEILKLDPSNKAALNKVDSMKNIINPPPPSNVIKAVYIPPEKRSKKPLRRVVIEEVGVDDGDKGDYHKHAKTDQPSDFDRFLNPTPSARGTGDASRDSQLTAKTSNTLKVTEDLDKDMKFSENHRDLISPVGQEPENKKELIADESSMTQQNFTCYKEPENASNLLSAKLNGNVASNEQVTTAKSETFPIPKSSCQFQAHWKVLKRKSHEFFEYFKLIDPKDYRALFTVAFDDELLTKILSCLQQHYVTEGLDVFPVLEQLAKVQRFSTFIMFLSQKYKLILLDLFAQMESSGRHDQASVNSLKQLYEL